MLHWVAPKCSKFEHRGNSGSLQFGILQVTQMILSIWCGAAPLGPCRHQQLRACASKAGFTNGDQVHVLGDGAPWIAGQVRKQFGTQGSFLVDLYHLYHVCDYSLAATKAIEPKDQQKRWLDKQKDRLKTQCVDKVLNKLQPHLQGHEVQDADAPVRCCYYQQATASW